MGYKAWMMEPFYFAPIKKLGGGYIAYKSAPDAPPAPDYTGAAEATAAGNLEAARYATAANRVDQNTAYGSSKWTNDSSDPDAPHWVQTTTLAPQLQDALTNQINTTDARSQYANDLLSQVKGAYSTPFQAPDLSSYTNGVQSIDQNAVNVHDYTRGALQLDQNAPVMSDAVRQQAQDAAYNSANAFLAPQYKQQESNLRDSLALQGLNPMSEASGQATKSFYDSKNQAYNQLAGQSILTGNQTANADYASKLAGYSSANAARSQVYANGMQAAGLQNTAVQSANSARNTAYANALSKYQTQYGADYAKRNMPLNEMNSLLTGQQVANPTFAGYAMQGQTAGADYSGAAAGQANYNQGVYNAGSAAASSANSNLAGLASSAAGIGAMVFM